MLLPHKGKEFQYLLSVILYSVWVSFCCFRSQKILQFISVHICWKCYNKKSGSFINFRKCVENGKWTKYQTMNGREQNHQLRILIIISQTTDMNLCCKANTKKKKEFIRVFLLYWIYFYQHTVYAFDEWCSHFFSISPFFLTSFQNVSFVRNRKSVDNVIFRLIGSYSWSVGRSVCLSII